MDVFTAISLCSGYEGLGLGLKRAIPNIRTVCYVENEAFAVANLVAKIKAGWLDDAPIWDDIKTFDGKPFEGMVDIIHSGWPCQPFSVAGRRDGESDPRHLWPDIERIIKAVEPLWFFGENVAGHLTLGFPTVYRSLRDMDYRVEAGLFSAAEVGAPHRRTRLFILARSNGSRCEEYRWAQPIQAQHTAPQCGRSRKVADTTQESDDGSRTTRSARRDEYTNCCWPARPGQPQYEWEEPRVVDESRSKKLRRLSSGTRQDISTVGKASKRQIKSRLGRTTYGTSSRVDRLRLLGNGVVPQQAEKAFRILMAKFEEGGVLSRASE